MGVPVVTRVGDRSVARAGWSQLSNLDMTELAARTSDNFVQIAVNLANDLPRLSRIRSTLRSRMERSSLMNASLFAQTIENNYRLIWRTWCSQSKSDIE
jgi:predicted O-linked N-acetylglucosamine transferase (SPINDLY family)